MILLIFVFIFLMAALIKKVLSIIFHFIGVVVGKIFDGIFSAIAWIISTAWKIVTAPIHILWGLFLDRD